MLLCAPFWFYPGKHYHEKSVVLVLDRNRNNCAHCNGVQSVICHPNLAICLHASGEEGNGVYSSLLTSIFNREMVYILKLCILNVY
uniref:Uncharacterized protein n=1 Tax=Arundo donax TaxID=35708 RepID=A0A0A9E9Z1_ARUDO